MDLPCSYYAFQKSLDQFIYFSPMTMGGSSGRSVKISKELFLPFFCAVDPATYDGQAIIRQIENLRTTCTLARGETGSSYANNPKQSSQHTTRLGQLNDSFSQVLIVKNLHVYYRISQEVAIRAQVFILRRSGRYIVMQEVCLGYMSRKKHLTELRQKK